jgi:hypothetical protein
MRAYAAASITSCCANRGAWRRVANFAIGILIGSLMVLLVWAMLD